MTYRLTVLLPFICLNFNVVQAQTVVPLKTVDSSALSSIPPATIDEYYDTLRAALRKHAPRIIFVPGILGSKIDACQSDGTQCKPIWGTESSITDSSVDLSIRPDRQYRTDVVDYVFFQDVYGKVLDNLRSKAQHFVTDTAADPILTVFPYDWRMSNGQNARLLADRVCAIQKNAPQSPIAIFAHSMGGLLTKAWLKRYSGLACPGGSAPQVTEVVFIATPHLGSPKSVKAFAEGYNLLFDELTGLKKFVGWWERNYLLSAINLAGMTFPSLYELLPIQSSENCRHRKPKLANLSATVVGDDGNALDLFQGDTWRYYDLLRRIGSPAIRQSFYQNELRAHLKDAEQLMCDLVDYEPGSNIHVTYLVGHQKDNNTFGWFRLKVASDSSIDSSTNTSGDGTVPLYSAEDALVLQPHIVETPFDHVGIVNSPFLTTTVDTWFSNARTEAEAEVAIKKAEYKTIIVAEAAATGQLLSPDLNAHDWDGDKGKIIASINKEAVEMMGLTPQALGTAAENTFDPDERGRLFAVAASIATDQTLRATWTNEVARAAYLSGRYADAIATSEVAAGTVAQASSAAPNKDEGKWVELTKQSEAVQAWSYLRSGNLDKYKSITMSAAGADLKEPQASVAVQWPIEGQWLRYEDLVTGMTSWKTDHNSVFGTPGTRTLGYVPPSGQSNGRCNPSNGWCVN